MVFYCLFCLVNGRNRSNQASILTGNGKTKGDMVSAVSEVDEGDEENCNLNVNSNSNSNKTTKVARKGKWTVASFFLWLIIVWLCLVLNKLN